jgi:hypothetical protein
MSYRTCCLLTAALTDSSHQIRAFRLSCVSSPSILLEPAIRFTRITGVQELFMSTKLYVGNLPYDTSEAALQTLFEGAGGVSRVNLVRDRATGQARGFAFVEMSDSEGARRAISELDKREFGGRSLTVNEARPMEPRSSGGGGGYGGGGRQRREPRW